LTFLVVIVVVTLLLSQIVTLTFPDTLRLLLNASDPLSRSRQPIYRGDLEMVALLGKDPESGLLILRIGVDPRLGPGRT